MLAQVEKSPHICTNKNKIMLNVQDTLKLYTAISDSSKNNSDEFMLTSTGQQISVLNTKNNIASSVEILLNSRSVARLTYMTEKGLNSRQLISLTDQVDIMVAK